MLKSTVRLTLIGSTEAKFKRELRRETDGHEMILHEHREESRWRVVERQVQVTERRAKDDATHIHDRDAVPIAWAIPLDAKREEAGRFWAFFPTHTPTFLPGILNAPWKLNSDRNAIITGEWNTFLMGEAAKLIATTLPHLGTDNDPGRMLDAFPRQFDRADEDAAPLIEALWTELEFAAVLPDGLGTLRQAREMWRFPTESTELARRWMSLAGSDQKKLLVHSSCLERQRGSRLKALADRLSSDEDESPVHPDLRLLDCKEWFSAIASAERETATLVLSLADKFAQDIKSSEWSTIRPTLAIVPSDCGTMLTSDQAVLAPEGTHVPDGRHLVALWLLEDVETKRILTEVLQVKPLDDSVWMEVMSDALPYDLSDEHWKDFWSLLRSAPERVRKQFASLRGDVIRVCRRDGTWVLPGDVLLAGTLVNSNDDSSNRNLLADEKVHNSDMALLKALGVCDFPDGVVNAFQFDLLDEWLVHWRRHFGIKVNSRASWTYLEPLGLTLPKGWKFLTTLTGLSNAHLTERFMNMLCNGDIPASVRFGHSTVTRYPVISVSHPLPWLLLKYGSVRIVDQTTRLSAIVARLREPALGLLPEWQTLQPSLERLKEAIPQVSASQSDIRAMWQSIIDALVSPDTLSGERLRDLWGGAARDGVVPQTLPKSEGCLPLTQIFVTSSPDLANRARCQGHVAVTLDTQALALWLEKGAKNLAELMEPEWSEVTGPAELLTTFLPELAEILRPEAQEDARCQPVANLRLLVAGEASPAPCLMWNNTLLIDTFALTLLSRTDRLQLLLAEVDAVGWLRFTAADAMLILCDAKVDELRAYVAQGVSLAERLLRSVGNREEPLRQALGDIGCLEFLQEVAPIQLAELVLAQFGPTSLTEIKGALSQEGLKPPSRWNTAEARAFVASIGFPEEFATSPDVQRDAEEYISGPIDLPPLHDFQEEVLAGISTLTTSGTSRRRAVVSLPTGGGKTRVTVEAAVLLVLKPEGNNRSVIWVAQTDELCEQAVQAFRQVWLNLGAKQTDLRIVRLWGGNPNPSIQAMDKPVVVVASIQTLNARMGTVGLACLQNPGLVVVDECHHAITPSYSNLLRFLDAEAPKMGASPKDEPPILGLSATPFRTNDDESRWLARRFDNRWLPSNQEDLHRRLRLQGVLAEVISEALDSGVGLTPEEIELLSRLPDSWDGIDFENLIEAINKRLAGSKQRNERLLDRIESAEEQSILFFANSVMHSEEMAARLNLKGIPSAAVSGNTSRTARRYFLSRFQRGELRVLCNHSVLSTGFDAPKTDMVLISRAVFSPVRYMQIVGRGLRGIKNGGKTQCRIVTVLDNLGRFQNRHPYHYCQRYFVEVDH